MMPIHGLPNGHQLVAGFDAPGQIFLEKIQIRYGYEMEICYAD